MNFELTLTRKEPRGGLGTWQFFIQSSVFDDNGENETDLPEIVIGRAQYKHYCDALTLVLGEPDHSQDMNTDWITTTFSWIIQKGETTK